MIGTSDFKKGLKIIVKNEAYVISDFQHIKPGKGNQFTRTRLRHLIKGSGLDLTIRSGEKFKEPDVLYKEMSFLYREGDSFHFMDNESYEQTTLPEKFMGSALHFLKENTPVKICFLDNQPVGVELPKTVTLLITETDPGFKGNTVTNTTKPARLETGFVIQVPPHINQGDTIKVNTSQGTYIERVTLVKKT